jgi:tRNA threonylcarbamoyladenosine biosynthesis protein TsaB
MRGEREERLMPAVAHVLETGGVSVSQLSWVICGSGPGSFTSLRIAAAIAKGLCGGAERRGKAKAPRLGAVSSLALIVAGALDELPSGSYLASLDALRGERYAAMFEVSTEAGARNPADGLAQRRMSWLGSWRRTSTADLMEEARRAGAVLIGPDEPLCAWPDAAGLVHIQGEVLEVDPASWEPDYGRLAEAQVRREAKSAGA